MSGRRMLHKNILTSERINSLDDGSECLFYRILVLTDDFGECWANPYVIKDQCFPKRKISLKTVKRRLKLLADVGIIRTFEDQGRQMLAINGWDRFQKLRSDRGKYSYRNRMTDIPTDIPEVKGEVKGEGEGAQSSPLSIFSKLKALLVSKNEAFFNAYPKQKEQYIYQLSEALNKGQTHDYIEKRILDTAGRLNDTKPWEWLSKVRDSKPPVYSAQQQPIVRTDIPDDASSFIKDFIKET